MVTNARNPRMPFRRQFLVMNYPVYQEGRIVVIPGLGLEKKFKSFQSAEAVIAGLLYGAYGEAQEHPSLSKRQAIIVAWDHLMDDPRYYKKRQATATTGRMASVG